MKAQKIRIKNEGLRRERRAKTVELNYPMSIMMMNIVRQFDMARSKFQQLWGHPGSGVTWDEGLALKEDALNAVREFSEFTSQFCERVGFEYYPPKGLAKQKPNPSKLLQKTTGLDAESTDQE